MAKEQSYYGVFERGAIGFDRGKMSWAHWLATALAAVTGAIHVLLYVNEGFPGFMVAAVVFFGAIIALLLNVYRRMLYLLGIPFTAGQIVLWVAQGMPNMSIALIDKPVQVVLIVLLGYLLANEGDLASKTWN